MKNTPDRIPVSSLFMVFALALGVAACSFPSEPLTKSAAAMSQPFSSGEILQVVHVLNNGEIKQAELALKESSDRNVRSTAQRIAMDHRISNDKITGMAEDMNAGLSDSPLSRGLKTQAEEIREELAELSGKEFDCSYLQKQVELHSLALETVRSQLLPGAEQARIKDFLNSTESSLERHLEMAERGTSRLGCER